MERYGIKQDNHGNRRLAVPFRGARLLRHAMYSKGSAFTLENGWPSGWRACFPTR